MNTEQLTKDHCCKCGYQRAAGIKYADPDCECSCHLPIAQRSSNPRNDGPHNCAIHGQGMPDACICRGGRYWMDRCLAADREIGRLDKLVYERTKELDRLRAALDRLDVFGTRNYVGSVTFGTIRKVVREGKGLPPDETTPALAATVREYLRASDECVAQAVADEPWKEAHRRREHLRQRLEELLPAANGNGEL